MGLANLPAEFQSVFTGHHNIEHKKRRPRSLRFRNDRMACREKLNGKSSAFEVVAHQAGNIRVVFNHVNVLFHEDIVAGYAS